MNRYIRGTIKSSYQRGIHQTSTKLSMIRLSSKPRFSSFSLLFFSFLRFYFDAQKKKKRREREKEREKERRTKQSNNFL
jgi:hypothetical protein